MKLDLSPVGRGRVVLGTLAGTLFCTAVVTAVDSFSFASLSADELTRALLMDTLLPLGLAGPMLYFLLSKMRQLAVTQKELAIMASTDSLTEIYNRGAFKMLVDAYLTNISRDPSDGAFFVVDADHFKTINDRFGHNEGDSALRLIAQTIKGTLRGSDIIGRVGGEEFAVFLPGATKYHARLVAERIRSSVANISFVADGISAPLSVSVGGIYFNRSTTYDELFTAADRSLYDAKRAGRNLVKMAYLPVV